MFFYLTLSPDDERHQQYLWQSEKGSDFSLPSIIKQKSAFYFIIISRSSHYSALNCNATYASVCPRIKIPIGEYNIGSRSKSWNKSTIALESR